MTFLQQLEGQCLGIGMHVPNNHLYFRPLAKVNCLKHEPNNYSGLAQFQGTL